ncbi:cytosolic phospholipase A2 gamma-like isoform X3 [Onychostoma macrolepis]|uniref:cytosolic phospholipase A2 gamma-like isoform X3 n=1 Tax=Onychostoma macrolepis TaxID=369639 RepID=UPI00272A156D|nr:cytosolic phospholipase A2 gamma-like isoform X3 [Onychostoma macrolepis]
MPTEKRRIQERERRFREAAKGSTSLQGWLRKSQPADEEEQSQASSLCEENVDQEEAHRSDFPDQVSTLELPLPLRKLHCICQTHCISGEVRIAHSLHTKEEEFVVKRRKTVFQSLQKFKIHCSKDEAPHIALLGSGGGQRAMVGLLGSLVQLDKAGLLDCILYLSGVSGSTWCMASLYQEPDWSTKLETVKDRIIKRLSGPGVSWGDALAKLKKYYNERDFFSLTDFWAAIVVTTYVKEVLMDYGFLIDKQCKQCKEEKDSWFEISPHEAGYSLTGAFVETSSFGSQFDNGSKKKQQDEFDMLYLQALCGSALADGKEIKKFLWEKIHGAFEAMRKRVKHNKDPNSPPVEKCLQVFMDLVDMNLCVLNDEDPSALDESIRKTLNELDRGKHQLIFPIKQLNLADKQDAKRYMKQRTEDVCNHLSHCFSSWTDVKMWTRICERMAHWIWGRNYDFLHNMDVISCCDPSDETVPSTLLESETRDYEDAGLLLNSPYFSVLREERHTDLIISLDFSDGDPFTTLREAADVCKNLKINFPKHIPSEDSQNPKDFYVFKEKNAPTVIHIPLFNVVNCGDDIEGWRKKYSTFQGPYSAEMITDLMEVAGKNISNNREKLLEQIGAAVGQKRK